MITLEIRTTTKGVSLVVRSCFTIQQETYPIHLDSRSYAREDTKNGRIRVLDATNRFFGSGSGPNSEDWFWGYL